MSCQCPAACNDTAYDTELSYSALHVSNIDYFLGNRTQSIQQKFIAALQTKLNLNPTEFLHVLELYDNIVKVLKVYMSVSESITIVDFLTTSVGAVTGMLREDTNKLFGSLGDTIDFYEKNLAFEREWIVTLNEELGSVFNDVLMVIYSKWNKYSDSEHLRQMAAIVDRSVTVLDQIKSTIVLYGSYGRFEGASNFKDKHKDKSFPSVAVVSSSLNCSWQYLYKQYAKLEALLNGTACLQSVERYEKCFRISQGDVYALYSGYSERDSYYKEVLEALDQWKGVSTNLRGCVKEYPTFLEDVRTWKQNMEQDEYLNLSIR